MPWVNSGDYSEWVEDVPGEYVDLGGGGDQSNVVFVPTNPRRWISTGDGGSGYWEDEGPPYIPPPQPAPSWLPPEDYVAAGFAPSGQPTPEAIKVYENAVASQDIALQQTGLMQTGVAPTGIRKAPDYLPKELYSSMGYNSQGVRTGDPLIDVQDNMPSKVMAAYNNILGRNPTQAELVHHVDVFSKKPDDYQWWLGSLSESPESIQRVMTGQTNWNTVEKNARLLSQGYGFFTPTPEEGGLAGFANRYGPYLPGIGATLATLGASSPLLAIEGVTPAFGLTTSNVIANAGTPFISGAFNPAALGFATSSQALPYTPTNDAANLFQQGITNPTQMQDIIQMAGYDPFLSADIAGLATSGLSEAAMNQVLGYSYNAAELANTGINPLSTPITGAPPSWFNPSGLVKSIGVPLGISAISKLVNPQTPTPIMPTAGGSSTYAPKGQVDYKPILDLLAPRQISRNLF